MDRLPRRPELPLGRAGHRKESPRGGRLAEERDDHALIQWNVTAKTRPSNAASSFDPAYNFDDIDEAVRAAQENDQEVILTLSGRLGGRTAARTRT